MASEHGWCIVDNGDIEAIADSEISAREWAYRYLLNTRDRQRPYRWTETHKLMTQIRPSRAWRWTGIEIIPAPIV
jgi:hypothetical protein